MNDNDTNSKLQPAEKNPWYLIIKKGPEFWEKWLLGKLTEDEKSSLIHELVANCGPETLIPSPYETINLAHLQFNNPVTITGFTFYRKINFSGSVFCKELLIKDCKLDEGISIKSCIFQQDFSIIHSDFGGLGVFIFSGSVCKKSLRIKSCKINSYSQMEDSKFKDLVISGSHIDEQFVLYKAYFLKNGTLKFENNSFKQLLFVWESTFETFSYIKNTNCEPIELSGNTFNDEINFTNNTIHYFCNFKTCTFKHPPDLIGSTFVNGIGLESNQLKSLSPRERDTSSWVKLKYEMHQIHWHREELDYFAKELQCRALTADQKEKFLIKLYDTTSNFGRSIAKPAGLLLWVIILFSAIYKAMLLGEADIAAKGYSMSLQSAFPFIPADKLLLNELDIYSNLGGFKLVALQTMRILQTLLSTILLFLIGLGIRNRLRIK